MPNRLQHQTSPYLLQHADNPVDWWPWGQEALDEARRQDKPILLSIGYSACHWCHVMAHESFEDEAVAARMNQLFINIKVDREERPDLDQIYQSAHQMLARRNGGWPLTIFLTPDGVPFFSGTYFPRESRHRLPGFPEVLTRIDEAFRTQRAAIVEQSHGVVAALAPFLPSPTVEKVASGYTLDFQRPQSIGRLRSFVGNFGMMVRAYQIADASRVAVFEYVILPMSALWSFALWGERLSPSAMVGIALIIAAGMVIAARPGR